MPRMRDEGCPHSFGLTGARRGGFKPIGGLELSGKNSHLYQVSKQADYQLVNAWKRLGEWERRGYSQLV